jgi:hypothetical protein
MNPKDLFQVVVRAAGLIVLLYGAEYLLEALLFQLGYREVRDALLVRYYSARGVLYIIVGLVLLRGASPLVAFAFPSERQPPPDSKAESPSES